MTPKILNTFNTVTSTGVDRVPLNSVILVEVSASSKPLIFILTDKTGITSSTTIADVLAGTGWDYPTTYNADDIETVVNHDNLLGFEANEHIDWTVDQGATNINAGNYEASGYTHPSDGVDLGAALTGATVISDVEVNTAGHVTGFATRDITPANISAATSAQGSLADSALQSAGEVEAIVNHDNLLGFVANEHIDWTVDQGATNINAGNYEASGYTHPSDGVDLGAALTGATVISDVEVNTAGHVTGFATRDITPANISAATSAQGSLADSALQSGDIGSSIQAYSTVLDGTTASYTTTEETKLAGIETSADATDTTNVTAAGALMDSELASIADVKALNQSVISGAAPVLDIANMTLSDASLVVVDTTNLQTFVDRVDSALLKARGTGFTSTYVSTVAVGGTTFAQPAVQGEIYSDQGYFAISYAGATGITVATLTSPSTYVYIDNAGNLQQQTSTPTRQDWSRKMFTMRIAVDTVAQTILGFEYLGNPIGHYANSMRDFFRALLEQGVPFKGGQTITGRAADLGFDVAAGTIMEFGGTGDINNPNLISLNSVTNATYDLLERSSIAAVNQTNLVKFWDNAGSITTLGSGTFVAHRLYRFSNGQFAIQYGQGNYANITLARAGLLIEDYVLNERLRNATFFGWWILGETATNTGGTTLTEFREYTIGVQGGSSSGLAGCLLQGNNLSDLLDVPAAQVNLDLEPGVDVQAYSSVLDGTTASYTTAEETKLSGIETSATADQTAGEIEAIVNHDNLLGFEANEHIDWTVDQGATNIEAGNYVNTVYTHPSDGVDLGAALTGASVISDVTVNTAGHVTGFATRDITPANISAAPLASPTFTGTPNAPTAAVATNTTQLATTAFVLANAGAGGGGMVWVRKTTTYTATADEAVIADTSGGIWTLTLPATPTVGDAVRVADGASWETNNLTVARNGSTIEGVAQDVNIGIASASVDFVYDGTTWQVYVMTGTLTAGVNNIDGGSSATIYTAAQSINGGTA